jgi:hypothetical protein
MTLNRSALLSRFYSTSTLFSLSFFSSPLRIHTTISCVFQLPSDSIVASHASECVWCARERYSGQAGDDDEEEEKNYLSHLYAQQMLSISLSQLKLIPLTLHSFHEINIEEKNLLNEEDDEEEEAKKHTRRYIKCKKCSVQRCFSLYSLLYGESRVREREV